MHYKHWTFTQDTPATTWIVNNIPEDAKGAVITHVIADGGQILQPDNQLISPDGLQLSFGVEAVAGTAYGTYYLEQEQQEVVLHGNGGSISVVINQHNGGAESQQSS